MINRFPQALNPHYQFDNPDSIAEITKQDKFDEDGALVSMPPYIKGGISAVESPWGLNQSKEFDTANSDTISDYLARFNMTIDDVLNMDAQHSGRAEPVEFCVKDLIVNPGHQLSLQKHRGREEFWIVKKGLLTVIIDGRLVKVQEKKAIFIPKGSIHCINNPTDEPIEVEELQIGICREADNIRLLDATRDAAGHPKPRPTYPLTNDVEYQSAVLFAKLAHDIALQRGLPAYPQLAYFL